jgi:hypothetical protein
MCDCDLFKLDAHAAHWENLGFHLANTALLFLWLWLVTRARWRSFFVAGLFALHPLHVESVAWIAERKDVLSGFFFLLVLLAYTHYSRHKTTWNYLLVFALFLLGLMAKPMLVSVPIVLLLLLDVWPLSRLDFPLETVPCRMASAVARENPVCFCEPRLLPADVVGAE